MENEEMAIRNRWWLTAHIGQMVETSQGTGDPLKGILRYDKRGGRFYMECPHRPVEASGLPLRLSKSNEPVLGKKLNGEARLFHAEEYIVAKEWRPGLYERLRICFGNPVAITATVCNGEMKVDVIVGKLKKS